jgi:hypothetical protein
LRRLDADIGEGIFRRRTVPMAFVRREADAVAGAQFLGRAAEAFCKSDA